jgi:hypothetical protein
MTGRFDLSLLVGSCEGMNGCSGTPRASEKELALRRGSAERGYAFSECGIENRKFECETEKKVERRDRTP